MSTVLRQKRVLYALVIMILVGAICGELTVTKQANASSDYALLFENSHYGGQQLQINAWTQVNSISFGVSSIEVCSPNVQLRIYDHVGCDEQNSLKVTLYNGNYPDLSEMPQLPTWLLQTADATHISIEAWTGSCLGVLIGACLGAVAEYANNWNDLPKSAKVDGINWGNDVLSSFQISNALNDEKVILYQDDNYGGHTEAFIASDRTLYGNLIGSHAVSSLKIIGNCEVTLWANDDFGGSSIYFAGPCSIPSLSPYGWNDKVSSIEVWDCDSRGVVFHGGAKETENGNLFFTSVPSLPTTDYNGLNVKNDAISSVQVVGGASLWYYYDPNYSGTCGFYQSSQ